MTNQETERLKQTAPTDDDRALRGFDPLQISMIRFYNEAFATQVIAERKHSVKYCICFPLESIPISGRIRKTLACKSNRLMNQDTIFAGKFLIQHRSNSVFRRITANYPKKIKVGKMQLSGFDKSAFNSSKHLR